MNTILGANWRTTLFGWIAVIASAIVINPGLIAFCRKCCAAIPWRSGGWS